MSVYSLKAVREYSETFGDTYTLLLIIADGVDALVGYNRGRSVAQLARAAHFYNWDATPTQVNSGRVRAHRHLHLLIYSYGELIVYSGGGSRKNRNQYVIPILPGEEDYDPQPCYEPEKPRDERDHECNGIHTPLTVNRELLAMSKADSNKRAYYERQPAQRPFYKRPKTGKTRGGA